LLKRIAVIVFVLCMVSCPGSLVDTSFLANNYKKIYKHSVCDPERPFPQMVVLPYFKNASQIVSDCKVYPKHKTALGLMIFYSHWVEEFGDPKQIVKDALEKIMITWGLEKKSMKRAYSINGKKIKNATIIGLTQGNSVIWVWRGKDFKISKSSFAHELVHVSLRAINGHGDYDHEGSLREGWTEQHTELIIDVKRALDAFGL
jgi:hypothetical protein